MRGLVLLVSGIFIFVGCKQETPEYVAAKARLVNMSGAAQDVQLPTVLFDEIQALYKPPLEDKAATEAETETEKKAKLEVQTEFFDLRVFLAEKSKGVLGGNNYELTYATGGGALDLKEFVQSDRGTFLMGIKPNLPHFENDQVHVFFLSNSQKWTLKGEDYGNGCGIYLDITSYFDGAMKTDGFVVNVANGRHVALLAGTYFFAISIQGKLYLSQLTVTDSRFKNLLCR